MKISSVILLTTLLTAQLLSAGIAGAQLLKKQLRLQFTKDNAWSAIQKMEKQHIRFAYHAGALGLDRIAVPDRSFDDATVAQILQHVVGNSGVAFNESNGFIVLTKAQQHGRVTGIISAPGGHPLGNVTIRIPENNVTTMTDDRGRFSLSLRPGTYTLEVSHLGHEQVQQPITITAGGDQVTNLTLVPKTDELSEVVVTALGIKREEKALGYAATTVQGEQLTDALSNNWTDALSGKVAGLNLIRSNGGPAGSNSVILRGENNITGSNEALIVVDGVIINHGSGRMTGNGYGARAEQDSPTDFGSGLGDINPEDIASVTVLKGPGAAALYGARGANGAVIIETKSGTPRVKGVGVTVTSNSAFEMPTRFPALQYEYGQGIDGTNYYSFGASEDGKTTGNTSSAYGPRFNGQLYYQYDPVTQGTSTVRTPWVPYPDAVNDFFQTGRTFTNSVTMDGGNNNTLIRFSATNVDNTWIMPNTGYNRNTIALSASHKVNSHLQVSSKINYTNKFSDNLPSVGYNNQTISYWTLFMVPNAPLDWIKDYWVQGREGVEPHYPFSNNPDNPYLITYEMLNKMNRNALTGTVRATYDFTKAFSLTLRTSLDFAAESRSQQRPFQTEKFKEGMYRTQQIFSQEMNSDFFFRYNEKFGSSLQLSSSLGGSHLINKYHSDDIMANMLLYPQIYTHANAKNTLIARPYKSEYAINSVYGMVNLGYKDYLFMDITGRSDWNSVLATPFSTDHVASFYPSVNLSAILSEIIPMPRFIQLAKLRMSYAGVGSGRNQPYMTSVGYTSEAEYVGGLSNQLTLANAGLKPLYTSSLELGTDLRTFGGRLGLDLTLYKSNTRNQILSAGVDRATGVNQVVVNSGEVENRGLEIHLDGALLKNGKWKWDAFVTFSANENKVLSMTDELPELQLQLGPQNTSVVVARVGGSIGALYGVGYLRAPDGQIIYENGYPLRTTDMIYLGNVTPKWKASIGNKLQYKRIGLDFLFDGQYGGMAYSMTHALGMTQGKIKSTLPGRENGIIGKGVIRNADGTFRPNDVITDNINVYYEAHADRAQAEANTFRTDFIKLREARLSYRLPARLNEKLRLQRAVLGVYGRDLWTLTKWPQYDPEFGTLNNGTIDKGFEIGQFPMAKTFGLSLTIGI